MQAAGQIWGSLSNFLRASLRDFFFCPRLFARLWRSSFFLLSQNFRTCPGNARAHKEYLEMLLEYENVGVCGGMR